MSIIFISMKKIVSFLFSIKYLKVVSNRYGLEININKTKFMLISKETGRKYDLMISNKPIER